MIRVAASAGGQGRGISGMKTRADKQMKPRCAARRTDGKPCAAYAHEGSLYCLWHDPEKRLEAQQARSKAGKVKAGRDLTPTADAGDGITLATPADALLILQRGMNDLLRLENSVSRARAVFAGVTAFARLYETSVLTAEVAALRREIDVIKDSNRTTPA